MKGLSKALLLAGLLLGPDAAGPAAEEGIDFRADVLVRRRGGYHTYRIPVLVLTARGTALLFCEGRKRSRRDGGDVDLLLARSEDGGRSWSKPVLIDEEGGDAPVRVGNPCAIAERGGEVVHLLFTRGGGECLYYTRSSDDGRTWSEPARTSDVPEEPEYAPASFLQAFGGSPVRIAVGPVHGIQTRTGRLIAPAHVSRKVGPERRGQSCVIYSDDSGASWRAGGVVPWTDEFRPGECTVVERGDGSLLLNMRAAGPDAYAFGYRVTSTSRDGGATWSKPAVDRNLPGPACQASLIRLDEGEILFLNPAVHHEGGFRLSSRRRLTLRLSRDGGRTWPRARLLNEGLAGYSDMAVTAEGKILCAFENGASDYCEKISVVRVDRAWLLGRPPGAERAPR